MWDLQLQQQQQQQQQQQPPARWLQRPTFKKSSKMHPDP